MVAKIRMVLKKVYLFKSNKLFDEKMEKMQKDLEKTAKNLDEFAATMNGGKLIVMGVSPMLHVAILETPEPGTTTKFTMSLSSSFMISPIPETMVYQPPPIWPPEALIVTLAIAGLDIISMHTTTTTFKNMNLFIFSSFGIDVNKRPSTSRV